MSLILRARITIGCALACSIWLAWQLAAGDYFWPALAIVGALSATLVAISRASLDVVVMGILLFGYLVGNRGFAQLMPSTQVPLLPAEIGLLIAGGWLAVQSALRGTLPIRRDLLNYVILLWLASGSLRVLFDVRLFGFVALRDYAMVYYAAYFFIGQEMAGGDARRFLIRALMAASVAQPLAAILVEAFPSFFLNTFVFRGLPLIYFKGDLALTFTAVSAFLLVFVASGRQRLWAYPLAALELLYVIAGENRASMLGAIVALGWLALSRARRFVGLQIGCLVAAVLVLASIALLTENRWADRKFAAVTERVSSIVDLSGRGTYVTEESGMKGDNNRFRTLWWQTVIDETIAQNPVFGLGFGYDLARSFLREYNPEMADEFSARSPHSIVVSTIGRMGAVGLCLFAALVVMIVVRTWRAVRRADTSDETLGLWASVWVILISACFGVVLEGPMGAVVFWTLLGLATVPPPTEVEDAPQENAIDDRAALQPSTSRGELSTLHSRTT